MRVVRDTGGVVWIIETKGREELDLPQKTARLRQWCDDATAAEDNGQRYDFVFVDEISFEKHAPQDSRRARGRLHGIQKLIH